MFYALVLLAALSRLLPHPPNLACVGAIGLFAGCYMRGRVAWCLPIAAMLLSDAIGHLLRLPGMGFYSPTAMAFVYGGFAATALIGRGLRHHRTAPRVVLSALAASLVFFALSNFGVWIAGHYALTPAGLVRCYVAALPFLGNTILGDFGYTVMLFGAFELTRATLPRHYWGLATA